LIAALLLAGACFALAPQMAGLAWLSALVLMLGLADGTLDVGTNTLLPWVFGDKAGPYFNGLHFCFGLGALTAPIIMERSFAFSGGIAPAFWLMALLTLPVAAALHALPSPEHAEASPKAPVLPVVKSEALLVILLFFAYGGSETAFGAWIFSYARARGLADDSQAAFLTSLFWGALTLGRLAAIPIAVRAPLRRVLSIDAALCALSLGALCLWPHVKSLLWLCTATLGAGMASFFPSLVVFSGRQLAPGGRVSGGVTSLFFVGSSTGSIALPWVIGQGFEKLGPGTATGVVFGAVLCMGGLLALLLRKARV